MHWLDMLVLLLANILVKGETGAVKTANKSD